MLRRVLRAVVKQDVGLDEEGAEAGVEAGGEEVEGDLVDVGEEAGEVRRSRW